MAFSGLKHSAIINAQVAKKLQDEKPFSKARGLKMLKLLLLLVLGLSFARCAAGEKLTNAELLFTFLADAFPGIAKAAGGLSTTIDLQELVCSFSNTRKDGVPAITTSCLAKDEAGAMLQATGDVTRLVLALINAGLPLDRTSEPATTYLAVSSLNCVRIECKSADPADCQDAVISYECSSEQCSPAPLR